MTQRLHMVFGGELKNPIEPARLARVWHDTIRPHLQFDRKQVSEKLRTRDCDRVSHRT